MHQNLAKYGYTVDRYIDGRREIVSHTSNIKNGRMSQCHEMHGTHTHVFVAVINHGINQPRKLSSIMSPSSG